MTCTPTSSPTRRAAAAPIMPTRPRVSTRPRASPMSRFSLSAIDAGDYTSNGARDPREPASRDFAARRDRQALDDDVAFNEPHDVDEVRDDAGMIGDNPHAVAGLETRGAVDAH